MKAENFYKKFKSGDLIHLSINDEEELIMHEGDKGTYLIQVKLEGDNIITTYFEKISDSTTPYPSEYQLHLVDKSVQSRPTLKSYVVLVKIPNKVLMYDPFLRRFLYEDVRFDEWYLRSSDVGEEVNLIREEGIKNFLLRMPTKYGDNLYPYFNKDGRLICIYNDPKKAFSLSLPSEFYGVETGDVWEESLNGDISKLTYISKTINHHFYYSPETKALQSEADDIVMRLRK